jgi:membrane-associated phospholipid phosphatase
MSRSASSALFVAATLASAAFAVLTVAVARGKTKRFDRTAKRWVHGFRGSGARAMLVRRAAAGTTPSGKWWAYLPAALATAMKLERAGRRRAALTLAGASVSAALLPPLLERTVPRRLPPWERRDAHEQSYPSGHALQTSAVSLVTSYVLMREQLAERSVAPLVLGSLAAGAGRLLLDRHWASDVLGGYFAGVAWGAAWAGGYELWRS